MMWEFQFRKAGKSAASLKELVDLCARYQEEAAEYFYMPNQPLHKWMLDLASSWDSQDSKEADQYRHLAREIWRINGEYSDNRRAGLQKFIEAAELIIHPQSSQTIQPVTDLGTGRYTEELNRAVRAGNWDAVRDAANRILALDSTHAVALKSKATADKQIQIAGLLQKASELLAQGNFPAASETYQDVIRLDPRNSKAAEGLEQIKRQQKTAMIGCFGVLLGLAAGGLFIYFARHAIVSLWLRIYLGFLVVGFTTGVLGIFAQERKMQALFSTLLMPIGPLAVLFGSYVLWQNWVASVLITLSVGYFISGQIQATFCWEFYKSSAGAVANARQRFQAAMNRGQ